jgi:hypothetical protein
MRIPTYLSDRLDSLHILSMDEEIGLIANILIGLIGYTLMMYMIMVL